MVRVQKLGGLRCTVQCNDQALEEYHDEDVQDTHKVATRYVQAITGAEFKIKIEASNTFQWQNVSFLAQGMCERTCKRVATNRALVGL